MAPHERSVHAVTIRLADVSTHTATAGAIFSTVRNLAQNDKRKAIPTQTSLFIRRVLRYLTKSENFFCYLCQAGAKQGKHFRVCYRRHERSTVLDSATPNEGFSDYKLCFISRQHAVVGALLALVVRSIHNARVESTWLELARGKGEELAERVCGKKK